MYEFNLPTSNTNNAKWTIFFDANILKASTKLSENEASQVIYLVGDVVTDLFKSDWSSNDKFETEGNGRVSDREPKEAKVGGSLLHHRQICRIGEGKEMRICS